MIPTPLRRAFPHILRVLIGTILLSAVLSACLYLHHSAFSFLYERLQEMGKKTSAWMIEQLRFSLPFILICLFFAVSYRGTDRRDGVATREKMWIAILVSVFTYAVLLPYVRHISGNLYADAVAAGAVIPETDAGVPWTLMLISREWFIRLSVPLALIIVFYAMRSRREHGCPDAIEATSVTDTHTPQESSDVPPNGISEEVSHD